MLPTFELITIAWKHFYFPSPPSSLPHPTSQFSSLLLRSSFQLHYTSLSHHTIPANFSCSPLAIFFCQYVSFPKSFLSLPGFFRQRENIYLILVPIIIDFQSGNSCLIFKYFTASYYLDRSDEIRNDGEDKLLINLIISTHRLMPKAVQ